MKIAIVGAGLAGCVCASLLKDKHDVTVYEQRSHIGGNCYDGLINNVLVQQYGAHIFHTNDEEVWNYVNRFSIFNNYVHKVIAETKEGLIPIPFNNVSKSIVGDWDDNKIIDMIYRDYSFKQWGMPYENIPNEVKARLKLRRDNDDCRYFTDKYQGIPFRGYTKMFDCMLDNVKVVENFKWKNHFYDYDLIIYTGKIDEYYDYMYGELPYRSIQHKHCIGRSSPDAVVNNCTLDEEYLRYYDSSKFYGVNDIYSVVTEEVTFAHDGINVPMYPMEDFYEGTKENVGKYRALAEKEKKVLFVGRLAMYRYMNMDEVVRSCLDILKRNDI